MLSRSHVEAAMVVALAACGPRSPGPQAASPLLTVDACRDVASPIPDHRCYAAAVPQKARRGFVDFHVQREGFAPGHYTRVEHHLGGPDVLSRAQSGCMGRAVAPDGTLCPSLVLPGSPVERDVAERIVELLEGKAEAAATWRRASGGSKRCSSPTTRRTPTSTRSRAT